MKKTIPKAEKSNNLHKNNGFLKIEQLFSKNNKNKHKNKIRQNDVSNKYETINSDKNNKEGNNKENYKKNKNINMVKARTKKIFEPSKNFSRSLKKIKKQKSNINFKTITNSNLTNRYKNTNKFKKIITYQEISSSPEHKTKIKEIENEKKKKKKYNIEDILTMPVKYINTNINFNNYFTNNKISTNYYTNYNNNNKEKTSPIPSPPNNHNNINITKKKYIIDKKNDINKNNKNERKTVNNEKTYKNNKISQDIIINDTEVKYINNDNEDVTESNERDFEKKYEKEKLIIINDDLDKYFKIVDSLNSEEDDCYNELSNKNENINKNIIFDDDLSSINSQSKERRKIIKCKKKNSNKIESPIKIEIKQDYKNNNEQSNYFHNLKNIKKDINNNNNEDIKVDISSQIKKKLKTKKNKNEENEFNNLLYNNKTFKKFLKSKIKYYIEENNIPTKFINSLEIPQEKKIKQQNNAGINIYNDNNKFLHYENFYDTKKKFLILKQNSRDAKNEKNIFEKKNINLSDKTNYEKLEIENFKKSNEIKKLKEKLNSQKIMIIEKKEIINELQNINHNLEKEVNNLKNKYYNEQIINDNNNTNNNLKIYDYDYYKNSYKTINNMETKYDINLEYQKLIKKRNKLIKIRDKTNEEYFNMCNNTKESYIYRNILEKRLDKINNSIIEIRKTLKKLKH